MLSELKIKKIKKLIYDTMNILDKTGSNTKKYKKLFDSMDNKQFEKFIKKLTSEDNEFLYLEVLPYKNEPTLTEIEKAAKLLDIPIEEYVYIKNPETGKYVRSNEKVMVGYLPIKRVQQLLSKKSSYNLDIDKRSGKTNQISDAHKVGKVSDSETYAMTIMGSEAIMKEMFGPRADNNEQKIQLYQKITNEGYASLDDLEANIENNQTLNTLSTFLIGAGLDNDLILDGLALPRTLKSKNRK